MLKHIKNHKFTILFSFALVIVVAMQLNMPSLDYKILLNFVVALTSVVFVLALMLCILRIKKKWVYVPLLVLLFLLLCLDISVAVITRAPLNLNILASILETNLSETLSMGREYGFYVAVVILFLGFLFYKTLQELEQHKVSDKLLAITVGATTLAPFVIGIIFQGLLVYHNSDMAGLKIYFTSQKQAFVNNPARTIHSFINKRAVFIIPEILLIPCTLPFFSDRL